MRRYFFAALWPVAETAIAAATVRAVRRASRDRVSPAGHARAAGISQLPRLSGVLPGLVGDALRLGWVLPGPAGVGDRWKLTADRARPSPATLPDWVPDLVKLGIITGAGGAMAYEAMALLGPAVIKHGPAIDEPILRWTESHQVKWWASVMERLTKVGNAWTIWGAAGTAAASLAVTWPQRKWLPPAALGAAIMVDHYVTLALRRRFGRPGPPSSPAGTYPCGGCDRVVLFYGLVAYLLWREFSGSRAGRAWAIGAVAALSFNEAYSREYLSKHWFSDIISGLLYGAIMLAPFIAAVRLIAGPPVTPPVAAAR